MALPIHRLIRGRHAAWLTLVCGLALTAALGWVLHREAVEMDRQRLAMRVAEIQGQLDARLEKSEMLLNNLRDYLMWSGESRERVFQRWCYENGLINNCPWILGIAVATNRNLRPLPEHLPKAVANWTEEDGMSLYQEAVNRPIECDLALKSELKSGNQFLADYDLRKSFLENSEEGKRFSHDKLAAVIRNSSLGMSARDFVMLDASSNAITGTLFYVPIYRPELSDFLAEQVQVNRRTSIARWLLLSALIVAPVDFKVLAESVWDGSPADLGLEIFSSTNNLTAETWMNATEGGPRAADPRFKAYLTHRHIWPMYRQRFSIFFYTTPLFEAQSPRRLAKVAMFAGTVLTLLASALVGVALRARNRQELMTEQIREARDALAAAQQERNKISRDLHDGTIQSLYAIQLGLGHTMEKLEAEPAKAGRELSAVRKEVDTVIAEIRQFITSLVTSEAAPGKPVDFCAVLQALVQRARAGTPAQIASQCDPAASGRLTSDQAVQLANITREALSNSLRHAKPRRVAIALRSERESVVLEISDDGAGFDPKATGRPGVGLASMVSRAEEVGGACEIQSSPGQGTCVSVSVPCHAPESTEAEEADNSSEEL